jgi:hypothetical protein
MNTIKTVSYLIVLVFLVSTIMDVVEMLDLYVSWFAIVTDQDLSGASLFSLMFNHRKNLNPILVIFFKLKIIAAKSDNRK